MAMDLEGSQHCNMEWLEAEEVDQLRNLNVEVLLELMEWLEFALHCNCQCNQMKMEQLELSEFALHCHY